MDLGGLDLDSEQLRVVEVYYSWGRPRYRHNVFFPFLLFFLPSAWGLFSRVIPPTSYVLYGKLFLISLLG